MNYRLKLSVVQLDTKNLKVTGDRREQMLHCLTLKGQISSVSNTTRSTQSVWAYI